MKIRTLVLVLSLIVSASIARADALSSMVKLKKFQPLAMASAIQSTQGLPSQSVMEIKGRIDMGSTNYYSVIPEFDAGIQYILMLWIGAIHSTLTEQEINYLVQTDPDLSETLFGGAIRPQFKQSEQQGYSLFIFMNTAAHPKLLEAFKSLNQVEFPMGKLIVKYSQNGPEQSIYAHSPATGSTVTKTIGPFQPK